MREFQQKKKYKKFLSSKIVLIVVGFFCLILLSSSYDLFLKKKQVEKRRAEAQKELEAIRQKNHEVTKDIEAISSPYGEEKIIRDKYNVKKQGEQVIIVMNKENQSDEVKAVKTDIIYEIKKFFSNMFN